MLSPGLAREPAAFVLLVVFAGWRARSLGGVREADKQQRRAPITTIVRGVLGLHESFPGCHLQLCALGTAQPRGPCLSHGHRRYVVIASSQQVAGKCLEEGAPLPNLLSCHIGWCWPRVPATLACERPLPGAQPEDVPV